MLFRSGWRGWRTYLWLVISKDQTSVSLRYQQVARYTSRTFKTLWGDLSRYAELMLYTHDFVHHVHAGRKFSIEAHPRPIIIMLR